MKPSPDHSSNSTRRQFLTLGGAAALACAAGPATAADTESPKSRAPETRHGKQLNLSLASYTFRAFSLEKTIELCKRAELKNICLKSVHLPLEATPDELAATAAKVAAAGLTLYGGGVIDMSKEEQVTKAFEYGKAAGLRLLVISPAPKLLPLVEAQTKKYEISAAIHNHGPGDRRFPTPQSVYDAVKSLDRRVGLCIDIGHTVRIGANLIESVKRCHDRLLEMHAKDVSEATAKGRCVQFGSGVIDIPALIRTLLEVGYQGTFSYEYEAEEKDPLPGLCECVGYTKGVLATLPIERQQELIY
jgi:sugar phosphate isomerase/epimerase